MSVFVIAEAGVNHNGDLERAKQLIDISADAGADAVKFQAFKAGKLVTAALRKAAYQQVQTQSQGSQYEMLKALELSERDQETLKRHCEHRGVEYLVSAFDDESLDFLIDGLGQKKIKFGSGELTNAPLLFQAASKGVEIILSTGMATLADIEQALGLVALGYTKPEITPTLAGMLQAWSDPQTRAVVREKISILQCTSSYPTPIGEANIAAMATIRQAFGCRTGYSDHTLGGTATIAAVALGAELIEKHVTLDRSLPGPDHGSSMIPPEFARLVADIRDVPLAMGSPIKVPAECERDTAAVARKRIVAAMPIMSGTPFTKENITLKRAERGLPPVEYWNLIGRVSERDYREDEPIER